MENNNDYFCSPSYMDEQRAKEQSENLIAIGIGIIAGTLVAVAIIALNS
jgi:hypothetical protein